MTPVTLAEVARRAGVSQATASRVLNGSERNVRAHNRARVQEVARDLGYVPHVGARALVTRTSQLVIVLLRSPRDPDSVYVATEMATWLEKSLALMVLLAIDPFDEVESQAKLTALAGYRPRAIIVVGGEDLDAPDELSSAAAPHVESAEIATVSKSTFLTSLSRVGPDATLAALAASLKL